MRSPDLTSSPSTLAAPSTKSEYFQNMQKVALLLRYSAREKEQQGTQVSYFCCPAIKTCFMDYC